MKDGQKREKTYGDWLCTRKRWTRAASGAGLQTSEKNVTWALMKKKKVQTLASRA